jgi:hypothetical protein
MILIVTLESRAKPAATAIMIAAAQTMIFELAPRPCTTLSRLDSPASCCSRTLLSRNLVVHGQSEQDREEHHRRPAGDRHGRVEPDQGRAGVGLEQQRHHAVGRGDRQQVGDHHVRRGNSPACAGEETGFEVPDRDRIPATIVEAFAAAG